MFVQTIYCPVPETLVILYLVPHLLMYGRALALHIDVLNHAVDRLAKTWRKDIKLLDTKLTVSRGAYSDMYE